MSEIADAEFTDPAQLAADLHEVVAQAEGAQGAADLVHGEALGDRAEASGQLVPPREHGHRDRGGGDLAGVAEEVLAELPWRRVAWRGARPGRGTA